jgi:hypothetical protein
MTELRYLGFTSSLLQVLVDTERDGHRVSFNEAFKQKGEGNTAHVLAA